MDFTLLNNLVDGKWKKHPQKDDSIIVRGVEMNIDKLIREYMDLQSKIDAVMGQIMAEYCIDIQYE